MPPIPQRNGKVNRSDDLAGKPARSSSFLEGMFEEHRRRMADAEKALTSDEERDVLRGAVKRTITQMVQDQATPAPFPLEVFPPALQQWTRETAQSMSCPPDYLGMGVLSVASSFIGNRRPIRLTATWREYP